MNTSPSTSFTNRLRTILDGFASLSAEQQNQRLNDFLQMLVPMFGTCDARVEVLSTTQCVASMRNQRGVQNQIGTIQSAGIILTAETAMGIALAMHIGDDQVYLVKQVNTHFIKRCQGNIQAVATISADEQRFIQQNSKGELRLEAAVTDETGAVVATCEAVWAWFNKKA